MPHTCTCNSTWGRMIVQDSGRKLCSWSMTSSCTCVSYVTIHAKRYHKDYAGFHIYVSVYVLLRIWSIQLVLLQRYSYCFTWSRESSVHQNGNFQWKQYMSITRCVYFSDQCPRGFVAIVRCRTRQGGDWEVSLEACLSFSRHRIKQLLFSSCVLE